MTGSGPLVSVIVPTFNRARFIERCVRSILDQTYRNLECIVMDGGSKDGSVPVLENLAASDPRLKFVSKPDKGEVFATNEGFDQARGEIIGVQASDDFYVPDAVESAVTFLLSHKQYAGVSGDAIYVDESGQPLGRGVITYRGIMDREHIRRILMVRYKSCFVLHGSFFGWKDRVLRHGKLDPSHSVTPDWDFYLRLLEGGESIGCLRRVQYKYTVHSDMGATRHSRKVERERKALHERYGLGIWHELVRSSFGRVLSYTSNPYRTPLVRGLIRELKTLVGKT
jgi:glycosyltransferase involved in cell wall biosynthesis